MKADVLILTAPFGSGHTLAAQAVAAALQQAAPDLRTRVVDLATHSRTLARVAAGYLGLLRTNPHLYRAIYRLTARPGSQGATRGLLVRSLLTPLRELLAQHQPQLVVCTHPFPAAVIAYLRRLGELHAPACSIVTDFQAHPMWVQPGIDRYFVAADSTRESLRAAGAAGIQVAVTGIPIRSGFVPSLPPGERRALVLGGGLGLGPLPEVASALHQIGAATTVVCGTNLRLQRHLSSLGLANLTVLGYTPDIARLMRQSDILITKPGGLTCSEALAVGLPMVLTGHLPGHEEENALALHAAGVAQIATTPRQVVARVEELLASETLTGAFRRAALRIGQPEAAAAVAAELLELLHRHARAA